MLEINGKKISKYEEERRMVMKIYKKEFKN